MTEALDWRGRVGDAWAAEWRRTDRTLAPIEGVLVDEIRLGLADVADPVILDVGCGAGSTSLALAAALPGARVTGIDLSEPLVAVARERAEGRADFEVADASAWRPADGRRFDAIVSRHGVMFFADPVAAFAHLRGLGTAGLRLVFSCFRSRGENEWAAAIVPIVARLAPEALAGPPPATGPFAFADPKRIETILTAAGFAPPRIDPFDCDFVPGQGGTDEEAVADAIAYFRRIGPFAALLKDLDEASAAQAIDQLAAILADHCEYGRVRFRAAAWIVSSLPETEAP